MKRNNTNSPVQAKPSIVTFIANIALQNIAGICNEKRNVAGLMPHPERACEPLLGSDDGKWIFESIFAALKNKTVAAAA